MMQVDISNDVISSSQRISCQGSGHDNLGYQEGTKRIEILHSRTFAGRIGYPMSAMHMVYIDLL
jgi:hypothetical protein